MVNPDKRQADVLPVLSLVPALVLLAFWEFMGRRSSAVEFFFSYPSQVSIAFFDALISGELWVDFLHTLFPTLAGFALGVTFGSVCGFLLLSSNKIGAVAEWNVLVLGSIPIFAIAPMMLVWFGIGIEMKVAMAALSTFFVALSHAYRGGRSVPSELRTLFATNGANANDVFRKLTLPMSLDWVFASLRLNSNLALLGVFIGEYMASERGLAHAMLKASSLYRVPTVLTYAVAMVLLIVVLDRLVAKLERERHHLIQWFAVDQRFKRLLAGISH